MSTRVFTIFFIEFLKKSYLELFLSDYFISFVNDKESKGFILEKKCYPWRRYNLFWWFAVFFSVADHLKQSGCFYLHCYLYLKILITFINELKKKFPSPTPQDHQKGQQLPIKFTLPDIAFQWHSSARYKPQHGFPWIPIPNVNHHGKTKSVGLAARTINQIKSKSELFAGAVPEILWPWERNAIIQGKNWGGEAGASWTD